ncbi:unnamed protein product [Calypogeia fissa]
MAGCAPAAPTMADKGPGNICNNIYSLAFSPGRDTLQYHYYYGYAGTPPHCRHALLSALIYTLLHFTPLCSTRHPSMDTGVRVYHLRNTRKVTRIRVSTKRRNHFKRQRIETSSRGFVGPVQRYSSGTDGMKTLNAIRRWGTGGRAGMNGCFTGGWLGGGGDFTVVEVRNKFTAVVVVVAWLSDQRRTIVTIVTNVPERTYSSFTTVFRSFLVLHESLVLSPHAFRISRNASPPRLPSTLSRPFPSMPSRGCRRSDPISEIPSRILQKFPLLSTLRPVVGTSMQLYTVVSLPVFGHFRRRPPDRSAVVP